MLLKSIFLCLCYFITILHFLLSFNLVLLYSDQTILITKMLICGIWLLLKLIRFMVENINVRGNMASYNTRIGFHRMHKSFLVPTWKYNIPGTSWKIFCAPENLEQQFSVVASKKRAEVGESDPEASPEKIPAKPLSSDEVIQEQ